MEGMRIENGNYMASPDAIPDDEPKTGSPSEQEILVSGMKIMVTIATRAMHMSRVSNILWQPRMRIRTRMTGAWSIMTQI
jgi:hypothetical protein